MSETTFDTEAFHAALDSQRQAMGLTWKDVADESSISASTLTRMAQGKKPDADGLAALLNWPGLTAEAFIRTDNVRGKVDSMSQITALLRADKTLSKDSAAAIEQILKVSYKQFRGIDKK